MTNYNISPSIYIEGEGVLSHCREQISFGRNVLLVAENFLLSKFNSETKTLLKNKRVFHFPFEGECCYKTITNIYNFGKENNVDFVVALGGGKAIDTGKLAGFYLNIPVVTLPTSAATCAAYTALSAVYTADGKSRGYTLLKTCPAVLILDFAILIREPQRLIISGMADALAKYYETVVYTSGKVLTNNVAVAYETSRVIYDNVFSYGLKAIDDLNKKRLSFELKEIIRTNILLAGVVGGIGGEGCRACGVHALNNGFTQILPTHKFLHGEVVAFSILVQLYLEKKIREINKLRRFYLKLNLPTSLRDIGVENDKRNILEKVIDYSLKPKETMKNMPFKVGKRELLSAILNVDKLKDKKFQPEGSAKKIAGRLCQSVWRKKPKTKN